MAMFGALGFEAEGPLRDHVVAGDGRRHDLLVLHFVEEPWPRWPPPASTSPSAEPNDAVSHEPRRTHPSGPDDRAPAPTPAHDHDGAGIQVMTPDPTRLFRSAAVMA